MSCNSSLQNTLHELFIAGCAQKENEQTAPAQLSASLMRSQVIHWAAQEQAVLCVYMRPQETTARQCWSFGDSALTSKGLCG